LYVEFLTLNGGKYSPGASRARTTSEFNISGGGTFEISNASGTEGAERLGSACRFAEHLQSNPEVNLMATPTDKFNINVVSLLDAGDHNTQA
jgi:hypothetical protein